jgi:Rrf2 family protein
MVRERGSNMVLGSKASTYAILAVIEVARHQSEASPGNGCMRAAEIAEHFDLPGAYAAKVMTQLVRADILHSDRGPRGGFRLTRPAEAISVLEIIEAVDGQFEVDPGLDATSLARSALGGVHTLFEEVVSGVRERLSNCAISKFVAAPKSNVIAKLTPMST